MSNETERPIDVRRRSAGSMTVGLREEGVITSFYKVAENRLLILKERAVYEVQMADTIDPDRTNEQIPNIQQRLFDVGTDADVVQATLIQADDLLNQSFLTGVDVETARAHAIEAAGELLAMTRIRDRVKAAQEDQIEALIGTKLEHGTIIPFLNDAVQDTKSFLNRSDHFMKEIQFITTSLVGRFKNWDSLLEREKKAGLAEEEYDVFSKVVRYMKFIREARNASEHPHEKKRIVVRNFRLLPSAEVVTPTFEFVHPHFGEPEVDLPIFMDLTIESLMNLYGSWLALLCKRKLSSGGFPVAIVHVPEESRRYRRAGHQYVLPTADGLLPLG